MQYASPQKCGNIIYFVFEKKSMHRLSNLPLTIQYAMLLWSNNVSGFRMSDATLGIFSYSTFVISKVAVKVVPSGFSRRAVQFILFPLMVISHHSRFS